MTRLERKIDDLGYWAAAMQRLARAAEATQAAALPSRLRADEVLAERARALAVPLTDDRRHEKLLDLIAFDLGSQKAAIEARYVQAVMPPSDLTPIPGAPGLLAGVVNFRGEILPVFRLGDLLGAGDVTDATCMIVLGEKRPELAFLVDAVEDVSGISAAQLRPAPWQEPSATSVALGVTDTALNVLDGRALLSDRRLYAGNAPTRQI